MKIIIDEFIESLKAKQASNNTIVSYERDIMKFSNYFEEKGKKIFDLTRDDMLEYIDYLKSEGKSNPTISRSIASVKRLYKYLLSKNLVEENIVENIESPKVDRKDLMILTQDEIEKLLEQPDLSELKGQRDKAMLEVLYSTGIRVTELISLKLEDVNLTNGYIKVKKKNSERHIPLGNLSLKCLKEYINKVRPLLIRTEEEKTLFINTNGQKMTRQGYWKILKQYKEQAKIDKDITPHSIRHSFAVHMLQNGAEIKTVQELLGHTDIASTMMYTQIANMNSKNDNYFDSHPRS
ncbi:tyrosine recombinase XerD [Clostridium sp. CAG:921]|nr:tyrosine recombinase XerD [Clostridium sp. CAG:921]